MPAGEIARHALPGQGAREQSAGATLAGRAPTTTEGGGGCRLLSGGGLRHVRRWSKGVEGAGIMYALGRSGCGRAAARG